jgi:hypothetical protein
MPNLDNLSDQNKSLEENLPLEGNQQETNETPTSSRTCSKFDYCNAPICPVDLVDAQWYSNEEFCTSYAFSNLPWIKNQRRISKKCRDTDGYFNLTMLSQNCQIKGGITGIDPDSTVSEDKLTRIWLSKHPEKKEMSEDRKEASRKHLLDYKQGLTRNKKDAQFKEIEKKEASVSVEEDLTPKSDSKVPPEGITPPNPC